jgi:hypothetical protein
MGVEHKNMARTTSSDSRPRVEVSNPVKMYLRDLKKHLGAKQETEVIAYLIALYEEKYKSITLPQDAQFKIRAAEINNQQTI